MDNSSVTSEEVWAFWQSRVHNSPACLSWWSRWQIWLQGCFPHVSTYTELQKLPSDHQEIALTMLEISVERWINTSFQFPEIQPNGNLASVNMRWMFSRWMSIIHVIEFLNDLFWCVLHLSETKNSTFFTLIRSSPQSKYPSLLLFTIPKDYSKLIFYCQLLGCKHAGIFVHHWRLSL